MPGPEPATTLPPSVCATWLPSLQIRRSRHIVQDCPSPVVGWADIPELSTCVGCCSAAWLQSRRNGADPRPSAFQAGHIPSWRRHDSPLLAPTLDKLDDLGPLPDDITVHLDAGYDSQKTRDELDGRGMTGEIAHKGDKAPIQAGQR